MTVQTSLETSEKKWIRMLNGLKIIGLLLLAQGMLCYYLAYLEWVRLNHLGAIQMTIGGSTLYIGFLVLVLAFCGIKFKPIQ